jgi:hypothetical protein
MPLGSGIHQGLVASRTPCLFRTLVGFLIVPSSEINLSTKQFVDNGLWNLFSWIACLLAYQMTHNLTTTCVICSLVVSARFQLANLSHHYVGSDI